MKTETKKYPHGKWAEIQKMDGKNHGSWVVFRKDGSKDWERFYEYGEKHGPERSWYEDGVLEHEYFFEKGVLHGTWKTFHTNGQLKNDTYFRNGDQAKYDHWYDYEGNLLASMSWKDSEMNGTTVCSMVDEDTYESEEGIATFKNGKMIKFDKFVVIPEGYTK